MQNITKLLIEKSYKIERMLRRDYKELQLLQTSPRGTAAFCNKSQERLNTSLMYEFESSDMAVASTYEMLQELAHKGDKKGAVIVRPIDGLVSLSRGMPFFSITMGYANFENSIPNILSSIMIFPALGETYYSEKNKGTWCERFEDRGSRPFKLRVTGVNREASERSIAFSKGWKQPITHAGNIFSFDSNAYSTSLMSAGKLDAVYYGKINELDAGLFKLMIEEAGGDFKNDSEAGAKAGLKLI